MMQKENNMICFEKFDEIEILFDDDFDEVLMLICEIFLNLFFDEVLVDKDKKEKHLLFEKI
jgi:hypothetical protein